ncbi:MAG: ferrochelatase [Proteobacteria bacterium]|nr:ferrochelatase [Pseudomonadota bacterium]
MSYQRVAVVLFNLGGPDSLISVRPFLFNLFSDPAILTFPSFIRYPLAWFIARIRSNKAQKIYNRLGGHSPLLVNTQQQALALEKTLTQHGNFQTFIAMRYWYPLTKECIQKVKAFKPDQIVLLPLYPQFSTTTTASSLKEWEQEAYKQGLDIPTQKICCYPTNAFWIKANVDLLKPHLEEGLKYGKPRILFSAHGLPQKIIDAGDPYQFQVEQTALAIMKELTINLDYSVCYQSRVGPTRWLKPDTQEEVKKTAEQQKPLIIVPLSFVSEHSETLIELDQDYQNLYKSLKGPYYSRVPTVMTHPDFIQGLAQLVQDALQQKSQSCFGNFKQCPYRK